jgi:hypothetical protein
VVDGVTVTHRYDEVPVGFGFVGAGRGGFTTLGGASCVTGSGDGSPDPVSTGIPVTVAGPMAHHPEGCFAISANWPTVYVAAAIGTLTSPPPTVTTR